MMPILFSLRTRGFASCIAAAAFVALLTLTARAALPANPIQIRSCTVLQAILVHHRRFWYPYGPVLRPGIPVADGIRIVYENRAPQTATRVAFLVDYRGDVEHVVDAGTFSPNAVIDHTFGTFSGDAYIGPRPNVCTARAVRFSDGTVWRAAMR